MVKTMLTAITVTVLLASSAVPSFAQYRYRGGYGYGGGWHGGGWNGGNGAALVLGLGLDFLGGALATAPYYAAPYYGAPGRYSGANGTKSLLRLWSYLDRDGCWVFFGLTIQSGLCNNSSFN